MQGAKFARTLNQVESKLRGLSVAGGATRRSGYLSCRYQPFNTAPTGMKVPDGLGSNITTRDYLGTYDIVTPATGSLDIQIYPFLPQQMSVRPTTVAATCTVNGVSCTSSDLMGPVPFHASGMNVFRKETNNPALTDFIANGRIVTVGFRLFYTGPAASCQGILQADDYPIIEDAGPVIGTTPLKTFDRNGVATPDVANYKYVCLDIPESTAIANKNSVIVRPEGGLTGVLHRRVRAEAHTFKPYHEAGLALITDEHSVAIEKAGPLYSGFSGDAGDSWPYVALYDVDFDVKRIRIVGASLSYRLEVITCVQFCHHPNFSLISLTSGPGESNKGELEADDQLNSHMPPATPILGPVATNPPRRPTRQPRKPRGNGNGNPVQNPNKQPPKPKRDPRPPRRQRNNARH